MATNNHILALTTRLLYKNKTCSNYSFNYYPFSKIGHISLNNYELRIWNKLFRIRKNIIVKYYPSKVLLSAIAR